MFTRQSGRRTAALALLAAASLGVTSCAGGGGESSEDVTELRVIAANSPWAEGAKALADEYREETGISVTVETYGNEQLNDTYKVKLNSRSSDFDIMTFQVQDVMREFARNGWLTDMTDYVESDAEWGWEDFQPAAREAVELDGAVYGVPVMTERQIVYYRTDLLEQAGLEVPTTLDQLEQAISALHNPEEGIYGVAMRGARVPLVTQLSSFLYAHGADFQDADGNASIATPEAVEAYEQYGRLLREYGPPGVTNMGWVEASALFAQGKAAFYIDADSQAYTFLDEANSAVVDTVGFAQFPEGPAGSRFYNIVPHTVGINAFSEKKDAAWDFIKWVSDKERTAWLLANETVPVARESAWADAAATEAFPAQLVDIIRNVGEKGVGHDRPELEQVAQAREIVGGPAITAIEGGDVASAAKAAEAEFQNLLDSER